MVGDSEALCDPLLGWEGLWSGKRSGGMEVRQLASVFVFLRPASHLRFACMLATKTLAPMWSNRSSMTQLSLFAAQRLEPHERRSHCNNFAMTQHTRTASRKALRNRVLKPGIHDAQCMHRIEHRRLTSHPLTCSNTPHYFESKVGGVDICWLI